MRLLVHKNLGLPYFPARQPLVILVCNNIFKILQRSGHKLQFIDEIFFGNIPHCFYVLFGGIKAKYRAIIALTNKKYHFDNTGISFNSVIACSALYPLGSPCSSSNTPTLAPLQVSGPPTGMRVLKCSSPPCGICSVCTERLNLLNNLSL